MVKLAEISWTDAKEAFGKTDVAILPVGSTEQHGPHNPLGTDHLVAKAVGEAVGERTGVPVLPVIPVGVSEHHRHFPGTLWVPPRIFREYVKATALAVASHGVRKILIVNGHGGNTAALLEVAGELRKLHEIFAVVMMAFPSNMREAGLGHAGAGETSVNLHLHGHLVMEKVVDTKQRNKQGSLEVSGYAGLGPAQYPWDTIDRTDTGVLGAAGEMIEATKASEEMGRKLMEPFIDDAIKFLKLLKRADIEQLLCKSHK